MKTENYYVPHVVDIPFEDIIPNPYDSEINGDVSALAQSILDVGLQNAPDVKANGDGKYILLTGRKRMKAISEIRKTHPDLFHTVPCVLHDIPSEIEKDGKDLLDAIRTE